MNHLQNDHCLPETTLAAVCESLYARVLADDVLSPFFDGHDVADLGDRQALFLAHLLSKDLTPVEQRRLRKAHAPLRKLGLTHSHFDALLDCVGEACAEHAVPSTTAHALLERLESSRMAVLGDNHTHFNPPPNRKEKPMLRRIACMLYAVASYSAAMASLVYMALWLIGLIVPNPLDGPATGNFATSLAINLALVLGFAVQHSVMARPAFKARWTKIVSPVIERATYVLLSTVALMAVMWFWQPLGITIWALDGAAASIMLGIYAVGWMLLVSSTFLINHFDLFGLRQAWINLRGDDYTHLPFVVRGYYHFVRHPLYLGWIVLIWAAPTMTISHLVFALATTAYIVIAIRWEERDLAEVLPEYDAYREQVPMLAPSGRRYQAGEPEQA